MADPSYIVDNVLTDGEAWVALASETLGSATATVTFTSTNDGQVGDWSQYTDLVIISYSRVDTAYVHGWIGVNLNNDTGSNYVQQWFYSDGASAVAVKQSGTLWYMGSMGGGAAEDEFGVDVFHIFDINTGKYKTSLGMRGADSDGDGFTSLQGGTWQSQAAVSEIDLTEADGGDIDADSRFDLFGVLPRMVTA